MAISDDELFKNANAYRIHQDTLRWTLLAGYAAFLVGVVNLNTKPTGVLGIGLVVIGDCYMFILAVENFFYNLFSEYVKDCESRSEAGKKLRTLREFSRSEARRIGPFHHSFFFAMLIVLLGNMAITGLLESDQVKIVLYVLNLVIFLLIFFGWRTIAFPYIVLPLQRIFDTSKEKKTV